MTQYQSSRLKQPDAVRPPTFRCLRIDGGDTVLVVVAGELDIATVPQLDRVLRDAETLAREIVLDLDGVEFVASCGARLLMDADARIRRAGGRLTIERAPDALRRILALICATGELSDGVLSTTSDDRPGLERAGFRTGVSAGQRFFSIPPAPGP